MADQFELNAELRTDLGKGASRRLRHASSVPAVVYGAGGEPVSITLASKDIEKSAENEAFFAHIITVNVGDTPETAIVKAMQRHPATARIMHVDFQRVKMDEVIHVDVPLHFLNEESCVGVKLNGGMVSHVMSSLNITCLPGDLPEYIEVDVGELDLGQSLHMSDLVLPAGVVSPELAQGSDHDQVVVSVVGTRATLEDDAEDAAGEASEGEASEDK